MFPTDRPSKFDKSLMDAYSSIHEGARKGHAAGDSDVEKQASQLASDVRYKAKGKLKPGASKEQMMKVYMSVLASSPAPAAVKTLAKKKILGEQVETQPQIPPHGDTFRPGSVKNPPAPELPPAPTAPKAKRKKPVEEQTAQDYVNRGGSPQHMGRDLPSRMSPGKGKGPTGSKGTIAPGNSGGAGAGAAVNRAGKTTNKVQSQLKRYAEELDPVGQRDGDVNDDGKKDKTDEYIYNRRDAIKRAIAKKREKSGKKVSEGYASWRMDLNYFEEEGKK